MRQLDLGVMRLITQRSTCSDHKARRDTMRKIILLFITLLFLWCSVSFASPLINQWADGDKLYCEYGDGEIITVYGNQNCPFSN